MKVKIKATLKWMPRPEDGCCCKHCALTDDEGWCSSSGIKCDDGYFVITKAKRREPKEVTSDGE